jgi:hypothetical protein
MSRPFWVGWLLVSMVAAAGRAGAQCGPDYVSFGEEMNADSPPTYFFAGDPTYLTNGGPGFNVGVGLVALSDPVRTLNTPVIGGPPSLEIIGALPTAQPCGWARFKIPASANPTQPGWPATFGAQDGFYAFVCTVRSVQDGHGAPPWCVAGDAEYPYWNWTKRSVTFMAWIVNGHWTREAPQPSQPAATPPQAYDGSNTETGTLKVTVLRSSDNAPIAGLWVEAAGRTVQSAQLGNDGKHTFGSLLAGTYTVKLLGNAISQSNQLIRVNAATTCFLPGAQTVNLTLYITDAGTIGQQTGGDPGSGSGSGGWLADALRSLFVPQQSSIDACKKSMTAVYTWGPFNLVAQLATLGSTPANSGVPLSVPGIAWNAGAGQWQASTAFASMGDGGLASTPLWSTVRGMMGAGIYLAFTLGVVHFLMPRHVVS